MIRSWMFWRRRTISTHSISKTAAMGINGPKSKTVPITSCSDEASPHHCVRQIGNYGPRPISRIRLADHRSGGACPGLRAHIDQLKASQNHSHTAQLFCKVMDGAVDSYTPALDW